MGEKTKFYQQILDQELSRRQKVNPRYSLRSFARFLDIDSSTLSAIMNGRRALPLSRAHAFAFKLGLDSKIAEEFIQTSEIEGLQISRLAPENLSQSDLTTLDLDNDLDARILVYWEYYALYAYLASKADQYISVVEMSERLGLDPDAALSFLDDLVLKGIAQKQEDNPQNYKKTGGFLNTRGISNKPKLYKEAHKADLNAILDRIDELTLDDCSMSTAVFPMDRKKIPQVKKLIQEFRLKLLTYMRDNESTDEVFQFTMYFFPIT